MREREKKIYILINTKMYLFLIIYIQQQNVTKIVDANNKSTIHNIIYKLHIHVQYI